LVLSSAALHRISRAHHAALATLRKELSRRGEIRRPEEVFPLWQAYAVAQYDAYASEWLPLAPSAEEYDELLNRCALRISAAILSDIGLAAARQAPGTDGPETIRYDLQTATVCRVVDAVWDDEGKERLEEDAEKKEGGGTEVPASEQTRLLYSPLGDWERFSCGAVRFWPRTEKGRRALHDLFEKTLDLRHGYWMIQLAARSTNLPVVSIPMVASLADTPSPAVAPSTKERIDQRIAWATAQMRQRVTRAMFCKLVGHQSLTPLTRYQSGKPSARTRRLYDVLLSLSDDQFLAKLSRLEEFRTGNKRKVRRPPTP
jgi:hypothetical protein